MSARAIASLLSTLLLAGCIADYTHPAGEASALVKPAAKAMPLICLAQRPVRLVAGADGYARIPAGRPVTLVAQFEGHDFVCMPAATFTAEAGASYVQSFQVRSRACATAVSKQDGDALVRVAEAPAGSYGCRGRP